MNSIIVNEYIHIIRKVGYNYYLVNVVVGTKLFKENNNNYVQFPNQGKVMFNHWLFDDIVEQALNKN